MRQQKLPEQRDYRTNPRSYHELPDENHRSDIDFTDTVSMTKQSEAEACDINNIMKRYEATGLLPQSDGREPFYGDFSTSETFQEALQVVSQANAAFYAMPAEVRARFQNDPARFLGFVENAPNSKEDMEELVKWGLATPKDVSPDLEPKAPAQSPKQPKGKTQPPQREQEND